MAVIAIPTVVRVSGISFQNRPEGTEFISNVSSSWRCFRTLVWLSCYAGFLFYDGRNVLRN
jgi:hypothetical protein